MVNKKINEICILFRNNMKEMKERRKQKKKRSEIQMTDLLKQ